MPSSLTLSEFRLYNRVDLHAVVTWDPANPGESVGGNMDDPEAIDQNGGVAFLNVIREGANLRFETWGTDTNGDYSADAIDIFSVPIDLTAAFPASLDNFQVPSPHGIWNYLFRAIPGNPYGFRLDAGTSAAS